MTGSGLARSPVVRLVALAVLLLASASAEAPARLDTSPLTGLNSIRAQLGLAPLRHNHVADRLVAEIAARDTADRQPQVLDAQPDCAVCQVVLDRSGVRASPSALYAGRGGTGTLGLALWRTGWSAERNLSVFFRAAALVLDPRARTFSYARTPRGMLLVAVTIDPGARFRAPVRWPSGAVNPRRQLWFELLLPPGARGEPTLVEHRGGRNVVVAYALAATAGLAGARLVGFGLNAALAYGRTYSAGVGSVSVPVKTGAIPRAFRRRSFTFISMGSRDRRAFLALIRRSLRLLRGILADIDGATSVVGRGRGCSIADACESENRGRVTLSFRRLDPYIVMHELGHAVFDLGLDEPGRRLFLKEFVSAGWHGAGSFPQSEIFADQLAFWALGRVPPAIDSYSNKMYLSPRRFAELLRENGGYRPLSVVGPLHR